MSIYLSIIVCICLSIFFLFSMEFPFTLASGYPLHISKWEKCFGNREKTWNRNCALIGLEQRIFITGVRFVFSIL